MTLLTFSASALSAVLVASLVEYWGHRLMHMGYLMKAHHARHHRLGSGQGWLREFRDYALPSLPFCGLFFLISAPVGLGFLVGAMAFAAVAAFAHQAQHENPKLVWWMGQPVHSMHHYHREWHHNFGITVDWWDRLFGTYKAHEPLPDIGDPTLRAHQISFLHRSAQLETRPSKVKQLRPDAA